MHRAVAKLVFICACALVVWSVPATSQSQSQTLCQRVGTDACIDSGCAQRGGVCTFTVTICPPNEPQKQGVSAGVAAIDASGEPPVTTRCLPGSPVRRCTCLF